MSIENATTPASTCWRSDCEIGAHSAQGSIGEDLWVYSHQLTTSDTGVGPTVWIGADDVAVTPDGPAMGLEPWLIHIECPEGPLTALGAREHARKLLEAADTVDRITAA